jgi:hypothetical protein
MSLEKTIMDLTARTPSGGTCWIGDLPFTVWYCSDCWEWVFRGVYYFDPLDLSEAIESFLQEAAEAALQVPSGAETARPGLTGRRSRLVGSGGRAGGGASRSRLGPNAHARAN